MASQQDPAAHDEKQLFSRRIINEKTEIVNIPDDSLQHDVDPDVAAVQEANKLPTCLMCVCLSAFVHFEEISPDPAAVPSLSKETAYLYAHFNKISKISKQDCTDMDNMGLITCFAFLHFEDNEVTAVSKLTESLRIFHLHNNNISTITDEMFCKGDTSHYIQSNLDSVRLDGDPINLSEYPNSFISLQSLSVGWYNRHINTHNFKVNEG
ncbi:LOW QUALITY PROTEIN: mimecan-like [Gambusia affinis]|uniref:LOW QUALITY PROTEIN: mimecan-like n=1 Tax=Gambusia affinis TaxID=33528 RepID=UPI001CDC4571|nr:LOW QUALITY PROTEIN: mimecan-like [Gambusia affinis]